jgi:hypothetical protein
VELSYDITKEFDRYETFTYKFGHLYCLNETTLEIHRMSKEARMLPDFGIQDYEEEL